ncbi:cytochrome aa3 quinol oxidase subunit IV [Guptibacillus hwajinpoensis]|uniref:Quinol oxidase subunit 4 n=2 Tax=Guptibacillus hwajinpoensis TaxID=208199 RepID=A0A0J6CJU6_9BACL|nr:MULTISPECIES: cytochrome aa3 quinol oxidase subunit IV [Alkalihalobacillus]KMM36486.1 quinol oxidase subunit 4 [Alkalihalobacillus macyae]MDQ0482146.1 cytochrome aa3-600 menaquinol oxidase subunit 4 [Alkalihalobacillus hemicentroti]
MASNNEQTNSHSHFPWSHVVGFGLSIVLTLLALWIGFYSGFSLTTIMVIVVGLALVQATIQLLMFMHITESEDSTVQVGTILYAVFIAVAVVAGTIWVMSFGMHYM